MSSRRSPNTQVKDSRIEKSIISSQKNQFILLWDLLSQNQKKALRLISDSGGKGIYTAERLQQAGFNSGSVLQRALSSLIEKEILSKNEAYQFQDAMLKKWIQSLYWSKPMVPPLNLPVSNEPVFDVGIRLQHFQGLRDVRYKIRKMALIHRMLHQVPQLRKNQFPAGEFAGI